MANPVVPVLRVPGAQVLLAARLAPVPVAQIGLQVPLPAVAAAVGVPPVLANAGGPPPAVGQAPVVQQVNNVQPVVQQVNNAQAPVVQQVNNALPVGQQGGNIVPAPLPLNPPAPAPTSFSTLDAIANDTTVVLQVPHGQLPCKYRDDQVLVPCGQARCAQCTRKWFDASGYDATLLLQCSVGGRTTCSRCQLLTLAVAKGDLLGVFTHVYLAASAKLWAREAKMLALREIEFTKRTVQTVRAVRVVVDSKLRQMGCPSELATVLASEATVNSMELSRAETVMYDKVHSELQTTITKQEEFFLGSSRVGFGWRKKLLALLPIVWFVLCFWEVASLVEQRQEGLAALWGISSLAQLLTWAYLVRRYWRRGSRGLPLK